MLEDVENIVSADVGEDILEAGLLQESIRDQVLAADVQYSNSSEHGVYLMGSC